VGDEIVSNELAKKNEAKQDLGGKKEIIGMIHCAGTVEHSLRELEIYAQEGLSGAIVENYHGTAGHVIEVLKRARNSSIKLGVNILPNEYWVSREIAEETGASFIQLDHIAGHYTRGTFCNSIDPTIPVYGGVWPKYYTPIAGSDFAADLLLAKTRAAAIVITGEGTGIETPISKLQFARNVLGDHRLIVGAGVTAKNCLEQLAIADGCIVGSAFKAKTYLPVDVYRVRDFMAKVKSKYVIL